MSDEQQDQLKNEISALRRELREMRSDVERLRKSPFSGTGWRSWPAMGLLVLFPLVMSYTLVGMFSGYSSLSAVYLKGNSLRVHSISFEDRDEAYLGRIDTIGATVSLRDRTREESFTLTPKGLRLEDPDAISRFEPYTTADGIEGVRIHVRSSKEPTRAASLFLALPDVQGETKPTLMLLDAHNKPVE